jgi:hypothetical protein
VQRIVDGILFEGNALPDSWEVSTWRANGITERSVRPVIAWHEIGPVPPLDPIDPERDAEWLAECRERSLKKAAQRAKTACRRVIIAEGFDELLTITYRENQGDRELAKKHFKEWVRRMKRALGGEFRYCASFERQGRGAMHVHVACHKLPPHVQQRGVKVLGWKLGTQVWRSIVGADNGLVFVGGKSKFGGPRAQQMTLARMASYVSKYIMKDYADAPLGANRYSRSDGMPLPEVERVQLLGCSLAEVIAVSFECNDGDVVISHRLNRWHDAVWLCTERPRKAARRGKKVG